MSSRSKNAWEDAVGASPRGIDWTRWGIIGLIAAAAVITVLSGIAAAALHERKAEAALTEPPDSAECPEPDVRVPELLREHRDAVFGN